MTSTAPAPTTSISANDLNALVAFWTADEALIDSDVAYPACPEGVDPDACDHWTHQPLKTQSGTLLTALLDAVVGEAVRHEVYDVFRTDYNATMASALTRVGVVVR